MIIAPPPKRTMSSILIIEDDASIAKLLRFMVEREGDGAELLAEARITPCPDFGRGVIASLESVGGPHRVPVRRRQ